MADSDDGAAAPPPRGGVLARVGSKLSSAASATRESLDSAGDALSRGVARADAWAAAGWVGRAFAFRERRARLSTELRAGLVTFLMVAYVLAVIPQVLGSTGGPCDAEAICGPRAYDALGHDCLFVSPEGLACVERVRASLITATTVTSLVACFLLGYFANLPLALAPGLGINIYIAYQVVGQGDLTYSQALAAIFVEGWIFLLLSLTGVRGGLIQRLPPNISFATSVGIGLLLAFTGLRNLGVVVFNDNTLLSLGGCPMENRVPVYSNLTESVRAAAAGAALDAGAAASEDLSGRAGLVEAYACDGGVMRSATMWLGLGGGALMALLLARGVKGSLFIGIAFITIISWIPGHAASYLGAGSDIPGGAARMDVFSQVVAAPSLAATAFSWDWSAFGDGKLWLALFTFLYIDLLDCTGTLLAMAGLLDDVMAEEAAEAEARAAGGGGAAPPPPPHKRFLSEGREFPGQMWAFLADGAGILVGSMTGVTSVTVYLESAAGVEDGGRTGVVALTVAALFSVALFFSPILASIPPYATGPALVLVGALLVAHVDRIDWEDHLEGIPAFLVIAVMPLTTSVAYGLLAGLGAYIVLHAPGWLLALAQMGWAAATAARRRRRGDLPRADSAASGGGGTGPPSVASSDSRRPARRRRVRKAFGGLERPSAGGGSFHDGSYAGGGAYGTAAWAAAGGDVHAGGDLERGLAPGGAGPGRGLRRASSSGLPRAAAPAFARSRTFTDLASVAAAAAGQGSLRGGGGFRVGSAGAAGRSPPPPFYPFGGGAAGRSPPPPPPQGPAASMFGEQALLDLDLDADSGGEEGPAGGAAGAAAPAAPAAPAPGSREALRRLDADADAAVEEEGAASRRASASAPIEVPPGAGLPPRPPRSPSRSASPTRGGAVLASGGRSLRRNDSMAALRLKGLFSPEDGAPDAAPGAAPFERRPSGGSGGSGGSGA